MLTLADSIFLFSFSYPYVRIYFLPAFDCLDLLRKLKRRFWWIFRDIDEANNRVRCWESLVHTYQQPQQQLASITISYIVFVSSVASRLTVARFDFGRTCPIVQTCMHPILHTVDVLLYTIFRAWFDCIHSMRFPCRQTALAQLSTDPAMSCIFVCHEYVTTYE